MSATGPTAEELAALPYAEFLRAVGLNGLAAASEIVVRSTTDAGAEMEQWEPEFRTWEALHRRISLLSLRRCRVGPTASALPVAKALLSHMWALGLMRQKELDPQGK